VSSSLAPVAVLLAIAGGYLLGSISFAVIVSRLMGLADPRTFGSGNPGATNVLRSGSKAAALLTLLGDGLKGAAAVWLTQRFGPSHGIGEVGAALAGLAAFVGHLYPLYFRFRGGKGVATFFGVLIALNPWLALAAGGMWVLVAAFFRYASLASVVAAALAPLAYALAVGTDEIFVVLLVMAGLLVFRHQQNIANLMAGKERRLGDKGARPAGRRH
jgi:glycerol-3-phosphate acyltransferase PlsY